MSASDVRNVTHARKQLECFDAMVNYCHETQDEVELDMEFERGSTIRKGDEE